MNAPLGTIAATIVAVLGASALRATEILIVAIAIVGFWRGASAARRHTIWLAALIACGVTVLASTCVPDLAIRFDAPPRVAALTRVLGISRSIEPPAASPADIAQAYSVAGRTTNARGEARQARSTSPISTSGASTPERSRIFIASLWAIGFLVLLLRLIGGCIVVLRAARRLCLVNDTAWLAELRAAECVLCVGRSVALAWGDTGTMPVTFGIRRPTVVIPSNALHWTAEERRVVLLHEVAHAVRGDVAAQVLADTVCALLWFHPLIWIARRQLRAEAERAADDCVLVTGISATSYAKQLLEVARANSAAPLAAHATVGMFANSDVERRFTAMLDTTRSRSSSSPKARNAAACVACVAGAALAALRIVTPAAAAQVARAPGLSGTWAADSMHYAGRTLHAKFLISIEQTPDTIRIVRRGPMQDVVGGTGMQEAEFRLAVPLDGTAGKATLTYSGTSYDAIVKGAWQYGTTFVTTITGERLGFPWGERDRWSLESNGSLALEPTSSVTLDPDPSNGAFAFKTSPITVVKLVKVP
jgi:beta-lactamase regulating signal transducer with metallopeptidase domain